LIYFYLFLQSRDWQPHDRTTFREPEHRSRGLRGQPSRPNIHQLLLQQNHGMVVWENSVADVVYCTAALILMKLLRQGVLSSLHIVPSGKKTISILRDVSGIIRPSRYICELFWY
jgi:hypothetical protein